eukprot:4597824-Pyramimonas_sp.AAC.1
MNLAHIDDDEPNSAKVQVSFIPQEATVPASLLLDVFSYGRKQASLCQLRLPFSCISTETVFPQLTLASVCTVR